VGLHGETAEGMGPDYLEGITSSADGYDGVVRHMAALAAVNISSNAFPLNPLHFWAQRLTPLLAAAFLWAGGGKWWAVAIPINAVGGSWAYFRVRGGRWLVAACTRYGHSTSTPGATL